MQLVLASMRLVKYCKNTRKRVENTVCSQSAFLLCGDFTYPLRHQEKMPLLIFLHFYNYIFLWVYYAYILPNMYRVFGKWFEPKAPCWEGAKLTTIQLSWSAIDPHWLYPSTDKLVCNLVNFSTCGTVLLFSLPTLWSSWQKKMQIEVLMLASY